MHIIAEPPPDFNKKANDLFVNAAAVNAPKPAGGAGKCKRTLNNSPAALRKRGACAIMHVDDPRQADEKWRQRT